MLAVRRQFNFVLVPSEKRSERLSGGWIVLRYEYADRVWRRGRSAHQLWIRSYRLGCASENRMVTKISPDQRVAQLRNPNTVSRYHHKAGLYPCARVAFPQETMTALKTSEPIEPHVGAQLGAFLADRREQIIAQWAAAVHRDRKITASEALTHDQLRENVSHLLENMSEVMANASSEDVQERANWTAAVHGQTRHQAGYDISELLRELRDLRLTLIPHVVEFEERHPEIGAARKISARSSMHRFLDDTMRIAVEQFIATSARAPADEQIDE